MKKSFIFLSWAMALCLSGSVYGQNATDGDVCIGAQSSRAVKSFHIDEPKAFEIIGADVDLVSDNTLLGPNVRTGYHANNGVSHQPDSDYFFESEGDNTVDILGVSVNDELNQQLGTRMAVAKLCAGRETLNPFLLLGGGLMEIDDDADSSVLGVSSAEVEAGACAKIGLGVDLLTTRGVLIEIKGNHVWGLGDSNGISFYNLIFGVGCHF